MAKPKKDKWYIRALKKLGWTVLVISVVFTGYHLWMAHEYKQFAHARGTASPVSFTLSVNMPLPNYGGGTIVFAGRGKKWRQPCPARFNTCEASLSRDTRFLEGDQITITASKTLCVYKCTIEKTVALSKPGFASPIQLDNGHGVIVTMDLKVQ